MLSQMIRKSIETRDWLSSHEPRHVRAAVRRVVEEVSIIDKHVGGLFEEGQKKEVSGVCVCVCVCVCFMEEGGDHTTLLCI